MCLLSHKAVGKSSLWKEWVLPLHCQMGSMRPRDQFEDSQWASGWEPVASDSQTDAVSLAAVLKAIINLELLMQGLGWEGNALIAPHSGWRLARTCSTVTRNFASACRGLGPFWENFKHYHSLENSSPFFLWTSTFFDVASYVLRRGDRKCLGEDKKYKLQKLHFNKQQLSRKSVSNKSHTHTKCYD